MSLIARVTALAQAVGADIKSVKAQITAAATALAANVRGTVLTGLSTATATAVLATDTVLVAFGKVQGRLNALGTAANANLTTSTTDTTVGNVLKVGDFGLGGDAILLASNVDFDTLKTPGTYYIPAVTGNNAPGGGASINVFLTVEKSGATIKQYSWQLGGPVCFSRAFNNSAWTVYDKSLSVQNIVGTVAQSGGAPTINSAIIETSTNANGTYTKFADGTMICTRTPVNLAGTANTAAVLNVAFAAAFIASPVIHVNLVNVSTVNEFTGYCRGRAAGLSGFDLTHYWSVSQTYSYQFTAIGRWF